MELTAGVHTSIAQDVPAGLIPDTTLHPKQVFDDAVTVESHYPYGTSVSSAAFDMYSWVWPTVDYYGLGAIQESSSLAFVLDASFLDAERGLGCSEAYAESSSTMKWVKVDSDSDGTADTWYSIFGSEVTTDTLCDGIYDGHVVVTDQGMTEALALAQEQNRTLKVLIRDITGAAVQNFELREVVAAWKYRAPVWWPDDPDNCWDVNDSMVATDHCSCKDDCRCMPGCSEADCSTDNDTLRSYTCAYAGLRANMTSRIQVKGSLRWLPEETGRAPVTLWPLPSTSGTECATAGAGAMIPTAPALRGTRRLTPKLLLPTQPLATTAWMRRCFS
ncbi:unnamed protein product [Effrenium voratum]|uniref:Uncharacterized protein n=1 Tax=Effrenium voratum TaxID=2562239 RepID=A0AA36MG94_9DINO|nr:unnamed protein product [Effrenium voratum]